MKIKLISTMIMFAIVISSCKDKKSESDPAPRYPRTFNAEGAALSPLEVWINKEKIPPYTYEAKYFFGEQGEGPGEYTSLKMLDAKKLEFTYHLGLKDTLDYRMSNDTILADFMGGETAIGLLTYSHVKLLYGNMFTKKDNFTTLTSATFKVYTLSDALKKMDYSSLNDMKPTDTIAINTVYRMFRDPQVYDPL